MLAAGYLSVVYAVAFVIYLAKLHDPLCPAAARPGVLHSLVLIGGVLLVALHGVSDVGIYGLLGGKLASYHDEAISYTLYLLTFALDSVETSSATSFWSRLGSLSCRVGHCRVGWRGLPWSAAVCCFCRASASVASSQPTASFST